MCANYFCIIALIDLIHPYLFAKAVFKTAFLWLLKIWPSSF
ncbi:hypothetical protein EJK48_1801 [Moraxella catarrhalis]|uniref:Uncharacterized protein n=1 Tax=Moraxella catarrhalis TaxID=480 RepID=A0A3Q9GG00_MORCA|nr:hypothetical protein EJK53_1965 [Moraxella catarrhalis]AZQ95521.1 hypothetical protein EJK48_1801 [Moraxella catarrhalis]RUO13818.1 hypothetical protein EJK49_0923 [Moraxella catarrhalis]